MSTEDEYTKRIVGRATDGIADVISRYRADELAFARMVDGVETWINPLVGAADSEWERNGAATGIDSSTSMHR